MDELQLHDLKNIDAGNSWPCKLRTRLRYPVVNNLPAVEVKQNAMPAMHDDPTVPKTPARGTESRAPIVEEGKEG